MSPSTLIHNSTTWLYILRFTLRDWHVSPWHVGIFLPPPVAWRDAHHVAHHTGLLLHPRRKVSTQKGRRVASFICLLLLFVPVCGWVLWMWWMGVRACVRACVRVCVRACVRACVRVKRRRRSSLIFDRCPFTNTQKKRQYILHKNYPGLAIHKHIV